MRRLLSVIAILISAVIVAGCPRSGPQAPTSPTTTAGEVDDATDDSGSSTDTSTTANNQPATTNGNNNQPPAALSPDRAWLAKLGSDDREELKAATDHFAALGDQSLPLLLAHAHDTDDDVRRGAIFGLYSRFNATDSQLVSAMVDALGDSDTGVRQVALEAINKLPKKAFAEIIPRLAPQLSDANESDAQLRAQVARMLARQKTAAQVALPELNQAVKEDPDFNVRSACLFAIYNIARNAEEALPAPTHVLTNDRDPRLRRIAAERLGKYKGAAAPAVPQLIAALADNGVPARAADDPLRGKDEPVCLAAVGSLIQIGEPAVDALTQAVASENRLVRVLAIRALGDIGPSAKAAMPALEKAAASDDASETAAAKTALAKIRGEG